MASQLLTCCLVGVHAPGARALKEERRKKKEERIKKKEERRKKKEERRKKKERRRKKEGRKKKEERIKNKEDKKKKEERKKKGRRKEEERKKKEERKRRDRRKTKEKMKGREEERKKGRREERKGFTVVGITSSPTKSKFADRTLTFSPPGSMTKSVKMLPYFGKISIAIDSDWTSLSTLASLPLRSDLRDKPFSTTRRSPFPPRFGEQGRPPYAPRCGSARGCPSCSQQRCPRARQLALVDPHSSLTSMAPFFQELAATLQPTA